MKNHFKSQLVINRFDRKIWFYDMEKRELVQKQSHKIFYEEDIYSPEVEEKLHKLEASYSNIIDNKIIDKDEISLTREELYLIKKFLLVDSIRQMYSENQFASFFKGFERNAREYFHAVETLAQFSPVGKEYLSILRFFNHKYLSEMNIPEEEQFMLCLNCILDNNIFTLHMSSCPLDIIAWAAAITESYLVFWDSADSEEFILTDTNMMSEYDMCHMVFGGIDVEKYSYLYAHLRDKETLTYSGMLKTLRVMYENYNVFNLTNTRSIICINPFFKLYSDRIVEIDKPNYKFPKPDIWPGTTVHHLEAYEIPKNIYKISHSQMTMDDLFIYKPYKLSVEETIAMNMQFLNESKQFIGFVDKNKVTRTFEYANIALSFYDASNAYDKQNPLSELDAMVKSMMNNKYYPIMKELFKEDQLNSFNPFEVFEKKTYLSQIGMKTNYYLYEYILKQLKNNPNFDLAPFEFLKKLGVTDYIKSFEEQLDYAKKHNKSYMNDLYNNKL